MIVEEKATTLADRVDHEDNASDEEHASDGETLNEYPKSWRLASVIIALVLGMFLVFQPLNHLCCGYYID
jgi:uncharacterized membrane protein HdeD (DUF308 family)